MRKQSQNPDYKWGVYRAEFDAENNYNDAPIRCSSCGHRYFRLNVISWICDNCETSNNPDVERSEKYRRMKADARIVKARRRGKRKSKPEATDFDGLDMG